jgi:flavin reductase
MTKETMFFRQVMGQFATGVAIVTAATPEGVFGLTVNAFMSVSLDPPLIAICVDLCSQTLSHLRTSGCFAVNVLEASQEALSQCFATPSVERYESFCHVPYHIAVTGSPILSGTLAFLDARIVAEYSGGDHVIILGRVEALGRGRQVQHFNADGTGDARRDGRLDQVYHPGLSPKKPLIFYQGQYRHLAWDGEMTSSAVSLAQDLKEDVQPDPSTEFPTSSFQGTL